MASPTKLLRAGAEVVERNRRWLLPVTLIALALLPLAASILAIAPGWVPVGDDATIALRGADLLTSDHPLLGMPSAVGQQTGRPVHHPGPLELWWVGLFVRSFGLPQASLVASSLAWATMTAAVVLLARRVGGDRVMALGAVLVAALTWSLRGELPVTPFNAHSIVVPLAAYLVALIACLQRVRWAPVVAILLGSWAAQAHLTAVGPVVVAGAVVAAAIALRWARTNERRPVDRRQLATGLVVLLAGWIGPILEAVLEGGGNPRAILGARRDLAEEAIGLGTSVDIVVRSIAWRPVWASAGAHPSELVQPATAAHWLSAGVLLAVAVGSALRHRRTRPELGIAVGATVAALAAGSLLASRIPGEYLSLLALHNHLWLWPLAAVLWGLALVGVGMVAAERLGRIRGRAGDGRPRPGLVQIAVAVLVVVGVSSFGAPHRNLNLADPPYVRALVDGAVDELEDERAYRLVISGDFDTFFVEIGVLHLLERRGIEVVGPERYRRTFGDGRTDPERPMAGELVVDLSWEAPLRTPADGVLAVFTPARPVLEERQQAEDELVDLMRSTSGLLPQLGMASTDEVEVRRWLREDLHGLALARLVGEELVGSPEAERYLRLRRTSSRHATLRLVAEG